MHEYVSHVTASHVQLNSLKLFFKQSYISQACKATVLKSNYIADGLTGRDGPDIEALVS